MGVRVTFFLYTNCVPQLKLSSYTVVKVLFKC